MTFDQYIQNPMGIKNAVFSHREMYRDLYMKKFNHVLLRENGKINYTLYKGTKNFYIHMKIPSEVIEKFYYDVVIKFTPGDSTKPSDLNLKHYDVQFYSNDPAFVFTYAHSFLKNGLFFEDLKPKMSQLAIRKNADEKNPRNEVGYVKSLYFAYLYMQSHNLFNKTSYAMAVPYNKALLIPLIEHADKKINDREEEEAKRKKKKIKEDKKPSRVSSPQTTSSSSSNIGRVATNTGNVRNSRTTSTTKTTKTTKVSPYSKRK